MRRVYDLVMVAMAFGVMALLVIGARAHSDGGQAYDPWCCNHVDCAPIPDHAVRVTSSGYVITLQPGEHPMMIGQPEARHWVVPYRAVRPATDGRYHACILPLDTMRCFYAPPGGV